MSENEPVMAVPLEIYCERCNGDVINTGPKYVHRVKPPWETQHDVEPVAVEGRPFVVQPPE